MHYCYILFSEKLDKYYIGSTSNIEGRIQRHNTSKKGFTSTGKPWILRHYETFETKKEAMQREFQLKKQKNRNIILALIGDFLLMENFYYNQTCAYIGKQFSGDSNGVPTKLYSNVL